MKRIDNILHCPEIILSQYDDIMNARVICSGLTTLYFKVKSRNAWNSTWITRYSSDSVFTNINSAINRCEIERGNGWVFCIREEPALRFITEKGSLFFFYINKNHTNRYCGSLDLLIRSEKSYSLYDVYKCLNREFDNWGDICYSDNDICLMLMADRNYLPMPFNEYCFQSISKSQGAEYRLKWYKTKLDVSLEMPAKIKIAKNYKIKSSVFIDIFIHMKVNKFIFSEPDHVSYFNSIYDYIFEKNAKSQIDVDEWVITNLYRYADIDGYEGERIFGILK